MAKQIDKTGVYRNKSGHGVYLVSGQTTTDEIARDYQYDEAGTKARLKRGRERNTFGFVTDAPQHQERAEPTLENRAEKTK